MSSVLKYLSRSVHDEGCQLSQRAPEAGGCDGSRESTTLTVWRKSLVMSCYGFTVIDSKGDLVYRVDDYAGRGKLDELVLMDRDGKSIITIRRNKKLTLPDTWLVYEGDIEDHHHPKEQEKRKKKPAWCVRKHPRMLSFSAGELAHVHSGPYGKGHAYVIEGSYARRSCKVLDSSGRVVAEIKRKENDVVGVSFGLDVFVLVVNSGLDPGFAMALVLLLDQMFSYA